LWLSTGLSGKLKLSSIINRLPVILLRRKAGKTHLLDIFLKYIENIQNSRYTFYKYMCSEIQPVRDKRKKFIQLAEARVTRAIGQLRLVGNLSNRSAYDFNEDDVRKIFRALQKELDAAKSRFGGEGAAKDGEFKLNA
jgi:predicted metalloendopeptidase